MGALKLYPAPAPAPAWWGSLADILGFSRRQSREFWVALATSPDARLRALVYRCGQHEQYLQSQRLDLLVDARMLTSFLTQTWTPHVMCLALETLFREGRLSRQTCSKLQERYLLRADKEGRWAFPRKMQRYHLLWITFLTSVLCMGCQGIDLFSPGPLDSSLCRSARVGGEDVAQCIEAQQMMRR